MCHFLITGLCLTAVLPDDYTALVSQQLTFTSGQSSSGDNTQCFDVDIVADNIYEGLEMFTVQLFSRITTVTIAAASQSATVDIEDSTSEWSSLAVSEDNMLPSISC